MKRILLFLALFLAVAVASEAQVRLSAKYNYPLLPGSQQDSILNGLKSIRGSAFGNDVDGDGRKELAVTNYNDQGHVHIFEAVGNDSMRLVWTSPRTATGGGSSTPRYVLFADLDNDGRQEVIYTLNNVGVLIFEWDGVVGSDNYGTSPSQIIGLPFISGVSGNAEYFEVADYDNDGQTELAIAYNSSPNDNDRYYIISAVGEWNTNDPGFSSFNVEYEGIRTGLTKWGLAGGTPYAMIGANFDGTGTKELLLHNWNLKNVVPMRVTGPNTYVLSDTTNNKQNIQLSAPEDNVALFGGMAYDIDGDGREEVYLPTYNGDQTNRPLGGTLHMISYNAGQSTSIIDSTNVTTFNLTSVSGTRDIFGYGYGDMNNNGKKELYFTTSYSTNVVALEFQGGDKRNTANWVPRLVYAGDSTIYSAITYRDSLGVRDTIRSVNTAFASKIWGRNTDFDGDGLEDIILPYQALNDSTTIRQLTWNSSQNKFDTVQSSIPNPKRWGLRIIERDPSNAVGGKDLTIIMPDEYKLEQNYPNPFNPTTTIAYYLPIRSRISLTVYDMLGREVRTLMHNEDIEAGRREIVWDGRDNTGRSVASGTYFYTLRFGNFEKTNKMMLIK